VFIPAHAPSIVHTLKRLVRRFGIDVVRYRPATVQSGLSDTLRVLYRLRDIAQHNPGLDELAFIDLCASHYALSRAQIFQDLFVQHELAQRRGGFFVEFGATDGVTLSNTFSLEKHYGWNGILAEPAASWRADLKRNRACSLDFRCVWDKDGEQLQFNEVAAAEFSTIDSFTSKDRHAAKRQAWRRYAVETVTLNKLLRDNQAPREIDYLSIDTEGSELRILAAFDFSQYAIRVITVEHNFTADRDAIHSLLQAKGFTRKFEAFSLWDDWYVAATK
jgi:FkbM family methyltransferase